MMGVARVKVRQALTDRIWVVAAQIKLINTLIRHLKLEIYALFSVHVLLTNTTKYNPTVDITNKHAVAAA